MYKGNRHIQRVIGSSSYRENYIWFNALILIYCIRKYYAPFRRSADCSICGCAENNLIEMNESCFHEISDALVEQESGLFDLDRGHVSGGKSCESQWQHSARLNLLRSDTARLQRALQSQFCLNHPSSWDARTHPFTTAVTERLWCLIDFWVVDEM